MQGEKSYSPISYTYNEYVGAYDHTEANNMFFTLVGIIILIVLVISSVIVIIYNSTLYTNQTDATLISQELIEHHGAYGSIWYEHRNVITIGNDYSFIDNPILMAKFRPGDNISIIEKRRKSNNELVSTEYVEQGE